MGILQETWSNLQQLEATTLRQAAVTGIILLSTVVVYKVYSTWKSYNEWLEPFRRAPSPDGHWLLGHLRIHPGPTNEGFAWFRKLCNTYKRLYILYMGSWFPVITLCHPDTAKLVLKTTQPKPMQIIGYHFLMEWIGLGLLTSTGHQWARNRRLLTPGFHFDVLKPYVEIYNDAADILLEKWNKKSEKGESTEIHKASSLCTLDVILRCAFTNQSDVQRLGEEHPYVSNVIKLGRLVIDRVFKPHLYADCIYALSPTGRQFYASCRYVHEVADDIIKKRRKALANQNGANHDSANFDEDSKSKKYVDFLDILLLARDENGDGLTDLEIRQEVDTFLFEGHDTTGSAITWILYSLAAHPDIQTKCQEEIDSVYDSKDSENVEWDDLGKFPYLTMCIKEALRLHSPVAYIARRLTEPMEIEGIKFPAGVNVDIPIYQIHHNATVWGDDHMEYKPERFSPENSAKMDPYQFIPFSAGPRNCIGQQFAMHEIKVVVIRALRKFRLRVDESIPVLYEADLIMRSKYGVHLFMDPRKQ